MTLVFITVVFAAAATTLAITQLRALRLGIVLGLSERLAFAEGVPGGIIRTWHGCLGGALLGLAGVLLAEMGGAYTTGISGQRGFLGLLVVAACWPRPLLAVGLAVVIGVIQLLIQRYGASHQESYILIGALVILVFRSRGRWPAGVGTEDSWIEVRRTNDARP
jgi:hypothetical protein